MRAKTFDKINQSSARNDNIKFSYLYDGLGRRLAKVVSRLNTNPLFSTPSHEQGECEDDSCEESKNFFTQSFAYLGEQDQILLSRNGRNHLSLQIDNQGSTTLLGDHLGEISSSHRKAYQKDHLGSVLNSLAVSKEKDSSSTIANKLYGAFGESNRVSINDSMPAVIYGFAGGELNAESGDYYFRARNYDPTIGRWTTKDPIGFMGGDSNLYGYVANDPVNWIDPRGTDSFLVTNVNPLNGLPGHTYLAVDDPANAGKFRVFDFYPSGGLSNPFGPGTGRAQTMTAAQIGDLGSLTTSWKTQNPAADAATILRAQELINLSNKGDLKYDPLKLNGLNCIGFGAAAQ